MLNNTIRFSLNIYYQQAIIIILNNSLVKQVQIKSTVSNVINNI